MVSNLGRFNVNQNTTITKQPWFEYIILAFASITQCLFCSLVRIDRYDSFVLFCFLLSTGLFPQPKVLCNLSMYHTGDF